MAVAAVLAGRPAAAHFLLNVNIRIVHVLHEDGRLRILARVPLPYLVADKVGAEGDGGLPDPAPYTTNRLQDGVLVHELDVRRLRQAPQGLGRILAAGLVLETGGKPVPATVGRVRAFPARDQPPFAGRHEAEAALDGPVYADRVAVPYVGDTVVDIELIYPVAGPVDAYSLRSLLDPDLPRQQETANLILDHRTVPPLIHRIRGVMAEPVTVSRSVWTAARTFVVTGIRHVLDGLDHVLFVFCISLGALSLRTLIWRLSGFTIGHGITLSFGVFGLVPDAGWFIPLVETGIALSILYAAGVALAGIDRGATTAITTAIGLLHGLGFGVVLTGLLSVDSPALWQSLLAFTAGIEIGQVGIVLATWPILRLIATTAPGRIGQVRWALAAPCIVVAGMWIGDRGPRILDAVFPGGF